MTHTKARLYPRHQVLSVLEAKGHIIYLDGMPVTAETAKSKVEVHAPTASITEYQSAIDELVQSGETSDYDKPEWLVINEVLSADQTARIKAQVQQVRKNG